MHPYLSVIAASRRRVSAYEYLLDLVPGASAAYSVRKLRSVYTGPCMRVRNSDSNAEADIGFVGDWIDETALLAHCGVNDGRIVSWYDQTGNGNHATNATTSQQPWIVSAGVIEREGARPAGKALGGQVLSKINLTLATQYSLFMVARILNNAATPAYASPFGWYDGQAGSSFFARRNNGTTTFEFNNLRVSNALGVYFVAAMTIGATASRARWQGAQIGTVTNVTITDAVKELRLFDSAQNAAPVTRHYGTLQEAIAWPSDITDSNFVLAEANANTSFSAF